MLSGELPSPDSYRTLDADNVHSSQRVAEATKPAQGGRSGESALDSTRRRPPHPHERVQLVYQQYVTCPQVLSNGSDLLSIPH